jgi:hypothetical protein
MRATSETTMTGKTHEPCTVTLFRTSQEDILLRRVRGEYREMPGMRLTIDQAKRLWTLDQQTCSQLLAALVAAHFLEQDQHGRYAMAHGGY